MGFVWGAALIVGQVLFGCSSPKASWTDWKATSPENPGTAEQLVNTAWEFGPNAVRFGPDGSVLLGNEGGMMAPMDNAKWTIKDGIVKVATNDKTLITATWDGQYLVATGFLATQVGVPGE
jgi:hypothetical protein